jgi:alpha-L-fucosidase 2
LQLQLHEMIRLVSGVEGENDMLRMRYTFRPLTGHAPAMRWLILAMVSSCSISMSSQETRTSGKLWYRTPAPVWTEALPIGNGRIGAMVFGGANTGSNNGDLEDAKKNAELLSGTKTRGQDEHLQLNESTVWAGNRADRLNPRAAEGFRRARALLLESKGTDGEKIGEAEKIAQETMIGIPHGMPPYSTVGDLYLRSANDDEITDYRRELDLKTGVVRVSYLQGGVHFIREVFASAPDHVIVVHITADRKNAISLSASMDRPGDFAVRSSGRRDLILTQSQTTKNEIHFQAQVRFAARGGVVRFEGDNIVVDKAQELTVFVAAASDFQGGPIKGGDPALLCKDILEDAQKKTFAVLNAEAIKDQQKYMNRMSFSLGSYDPVLSEMPTDERLKRVSAGKDDFGLQALYFQYARFLLLGSSRPGGLPANLQGLWASGLSNPWGSKWTININTEMNYWLAEAANLSEMHQPLFDLVSMVRDPSSGTGVKVAKEYYGASGFVIHHNTDIWGDAEPIDGYQSGIWPDGGAWLTLHAWDHYAFTGDKSFLKAQAWPLLHDASFFFLDYLTDDGAGHLVTGPSISPENKYKLADGSVHSLTMAPTMDIEIVRELFQRTMQAGALLGEDGAFLEKVHQASTRLPAFKVGSFGQLQEWQQDYQEEAPGHRHISHLWALFPGTQIDIRHTPDLAQSAQISLERRLANGGGQTGWSRAWVVNYWDHLHNGHEAYDSLQVLFKQSTFPNLMDTHPPGVFQIDGNLGGANGMLEALVQSRWYADHCEVDLMPALPDEWKQGYVLGLRVRGNQELSLRWNNGKLTEVTWVAHQDGKFEIALPTGIHLHPTNALARTDIIESAPGILSLVAHAGKSYDLRFD